MLVVLVISMTQMKVERPKRSIRIRFDAIWPARGWAFTGFTLIFCIGPGVGALLIPVPPPAVLMDSQSLQSIQIGSELFEDPRSVQVTFSTTFPLTLTLGDSGRVTSCSSCADDSLISGISPFSLNGKPVIASTTAVPLWRNLSVGMIGSDVYALTSELVRHNLLNLVSDKFTPSVGLAWVNLQKSNGIVTPSQDVAIDSILWLPHPSIRIQSWYIQLGAVIQSNSHIATIAPSLMSLSASSFTNKNLLPGNRYISIFGEIYQSNNLSTPITNQSFLDSISSTDSYVQWVLQGGASPISASTYLVNPITVWRVPPTSLFSISTNHACIQSASSENYIVPVAIVASLLGTTLIVPQYSYEMPDRVLLGKAITASGCS